VTAVSVLSVREASADDRETVVGLLAGSWGETTLLAHGVAYDAALLPALLAERDGKVAGLLTYTVDEGEGLEIVTLDAVERRSGAGTALLASAVDVARAVGTRRIWLVTTNDNLDALRFYQRRGLRIVGVAPGAVDESRTRKPSIPLVGEHGIEIHDELTLELRL
jgi:N-acetylglutamate synthase-like GNAT family acetyltransferase